MPAPFSMVFVTVPDQKVAEALSRGLVEGKLAACVNALPGVASTYWDEGKVVQSSELLLIAKTRTGLIPRVIRYVQQNHPYKLPEVITTPIEHGSRNYFDWLGANTRFAEPLREDG